MRVPTYVLAAWTLFTWGTRIRNAAQADERLLVFVVPVVLTVLALMAIARPRRWGRLLALAASLAWVVRVPAILIGDYGVAFKVVHTMLAVITWTLAVWSLRAEARRPVTA